MSEAPLAERLMAGDTRALARAIRMVEDRDPGIADLLRQVRERAGAARVVGVTGPPGSGKSTLCDQVIERWRAGGHLIGVIAVDPSSPFTGGAILGDRVRMVRHTLDPGVFIRSMAARGHLGGLAAAAREAIRLLDASGRDRCLLETVGVGQSELEVMETADTTVVVTTPATGDAVQIIKAGILEIADIFVVNKADLPGASKVVRDLKELVRHGEDQRRVVAAGPHHRRRGPGGRRRAGRGHRPARRHDRATGRARASPDLAPAGRSRGDRGRASGGARAKCAA